MFSRQKLERYAEVVVVQGLAVQPGQVVNVSAELVHIELVRAITARCYAAGARHVSYELIDPFCERAHVLYAPEDGLDLIPRHFAERSNEITERCGCNVRIVGMEDPSFWEGVDSTRMSRVLRRKQETRELFYEKGINQGAVQWCVVAGATEAWARTLYPELSSERALEQLWEQLYSLVRADQEDFLAAWRDHARRLAQRREWLNSLGIRELRFRGEGTDLTVRLSPRAIFAGGPKRAACGVEFTANLPTEEVFTTPDWRGTSGVVRVTRPVLVQGKSVKGLVCEFRDGRLCDFSAEAGGDAFSALISTDEGARQLGEVALVGIDSPVFTSGVIFNEILLDENAACHIALGSAYKSCIKDAHEISMNELRTLGVNESKVHTDFMISDEGTDVDALTAQGEVVPVIRAGLFVLQQCSLIQERKSSE